MPFVTRDRSGLIVGLTGLPSYDGQEFLGDEDPQLTPAAQAAARVNAEAYRRIAKIVPEWKQRNMTARTVALDSVAAGRYIQDDGTFADAREWTTAEKADVIAIRKAWEWIETVRAASNLIQADAADLTPEQIKTDPRWPADPE